MPNWWSMLHLKRLYRLELLRLPKSAAWRPAAEQPSSQFAAIASGAALAGTSAWPA